jgi:DNA-binding XRE family transcriptional regulator
MADPIKTRTSPTRLAVGAAWTAEAKALRVRLGLTQAGFAARLGVGVAQVQACEGGRRCYSLALRRKIADMGGDRTVLRVDEEYCPHCGHPAD